jgi:hypothetical protein
VFIAQNGLLSCASSGSYPPKAQIVFMVASQTLRYRFLSRLCRPLTFVCVLERTTYLSLPLLFLCDSTHGAMVRIEPNGSQALLSHDDALGDLVAHGWDSFIRRFEGYNLAVAQAFAQSFDGSKAKIGDLQLEVTKDSIAQATGLSKKGIDGLRTSKSKACPGVFSWHPRNHSVSQKRHGFAGWILSKQVTNLEKPLKTHFRNGVVYLPNGKFLQK